MSAENNGGSAFPDFRQDGMTLRDYFAAKAMVALLPQAAKVGDGLYKQVPQAAYAMADAMLAERAK
jgi:hypothetical protein